MTVDVALYVQTDANCSANAIQKQDGMDTVLNATCDGRHRNSIETYVLVMAGFQSLSYVRSESVLPSQ